MKKCSTWNNRLSYCSVYSDAWAQCIQYDSQGKPDGKESVISTFGCYEQIYEPNMYIVDKKPVSSYDVEKAVIEDINERLTAGGTAIATVYVCDMEKGIISAGIEEEFKLLQV